MGEYIWKYQKKLRRGITTGTCSAAAAQAAARFLFFGERKESIGILTPKQVRVEVPVYYEESGEDFAEFYVKKDSGDDPDVTNGAKVCVRVSRKKPDGERWFTSDDYPELFLTGGTGIGTVTKKGLEQEVGMSAINKVPREMIFRAVGEIQKMTEEHSNLWIVVSIPDGEELAKKTFNSKLGIEGGLSVLGTSGILEPMSEQSIIDTIEVEIRQYAGQGGTSLLVMPGNYGQAYASEYLKLDLKNSVKCSNYIGDTLDLAVNYGIREFLLVGNIGKLVKLAAGIMNTHSRIADGRQEIFCTHASLAGADKEVIRKLLNSINTEEMLGILEEEHLREPVLQSICEKIQEHMEFRIKGQMTFGVVLFSEHYGYLGQTKDTKKIIEHYRHEIG